MSHGSDANKKSARNSNSSTAAFVSAFEYTEQETNICGSGRFRVFAGDDVIFWDHRRAKHFSSFGVCLVFFLFPSNMDRKQEVAFQ